MKSKKIHNKNLARIVEYLTCLDLNVCNIPKSVRRKMYKDMNHKKRHVIWNKLAKEAYDKELFTIPSYDYATNYNITVLGLNLTKKFYKPELHVDFKY